MSTSKQIVTGLGVLALTMTFWLMAGVPFVRTNATATKVCAAPHAHSVTDALARAAAKVGKQCQTNEWRGSNVVGRTRGTELWEAVKSEAISTTTGAVPRVRTRGVELWEKE